MTSASLHALHGPTTVAPRSAATHAEPGGDPPARRHGPRAHAPALQRPGGRARIARRLARGRWRVATSPRRARRSSTRARSQLDGVFRRHASHLRAPARHAAARRFNAPCGRRCATSRYGDDRSPTASSPRRIGNPRAVRAVGLANGATRSASSCRATA